MTETPPRPRDRGWTGLLLTSLKHLTAIGVALVLAFAAFNYAIMPMLVNQGEQVQVPDVSGMEIGDALAALAAAELAVRDTLERTSANVPAGLVLDQEPAPGRWVKPERRLRLIVSAGGKERRVPDMDGQTLRFARLTLGQEGYVLGDVVRIAMDGVAPDFVLGSDPAPDTPLAPGRSVSLLVSAGGTPDAWVLPDLRGRRLGRVEDELKLAGFLVDTRIETDDRFTFGIEVVRTIPPPGAVVHRGDPIQLIGG